MSPKKQYTLLLHISLPNVDRFLIFFSLLDLAVNT